MSFLILPIWRREKFLEECSYGRSLKLDNLPLAMSLMPEDPNIVPGAYGTWEGLPLALCVIPELVNMPQLRSVMGGHRYCCLTLVNLEDGVMLHTRVDLSGSLPFISGSPDKVYNPNPQGWLELLETVLNAQVAAMRLGATENEPSWYAEDRRQETSLEMMTSGANTFGPVNATPAESVWHVSTQWHDVEPQPPKGKRR